MTAVVPTAAAIRSGWKYISTLVVIRLPSISADAAVIATSLRARPLGEKATIVAAVREHVWPLIEAGEVRPVVMSRHPLADAAAAHRELEASAHIGKILLTP